MLLKASSTVMSISRFWFVVDCVAVCRGCLCDCFLFGSLDFQLDWCIWFDLLFQLPASTTGFILLLVLCSVVWLFSYFLAMFVCFFGFWLPGLFSDLLRFAGINSFNFASTAIEKLGRLTVLARNGLVLVPTVASCRLLSLFPCCRSDSLAVL
ncbi:hypothetical protein QL285_043633 [Trifolium repens]|nr:hypothetical protein QL285_043633 [Trifolium repens]